MESEKQRIWRQTPRMCACEEFMGEFPENGGKVWVCRRCHDIEKRVQETMLKHARRAQFQRVVEPYRLLLPQGQL